MSFRSSLSWSLGAGWMLAPPLALLSVLLVNGHSFDANGADNSALLAILYISYLVTFFGIGLIGLPLVVLLAKIGGDHMIGAGLGLFVLFSLPIGFSHDDDIIQMALVTMSFTALIFLLVYFGFAKIGSKADEQHNA